MLIPMQTLNDARKTMNDRDRPRFVAPESCTAYARSIDQALSECHQDQQSHCIDLDRQGRGDAYLFF